MKHKIKISILVSIIFLELIFIVLLLNNVIFSKFTTGSYIESLKRYETELISTYPNESPEHPPHFTRDSNNSILMWELISNFHQICDGEMVKLQKTVSVDINSDGFRDREYSIEKLNNTYRIIVLGDSYTFGHGVELSESFVKIIEKRLNELDNGIIYEVLNFGVPGYDLTQKIEILNSKGIKYQPNLVILQYLSDDYVENINLNRARQDIDKYDDAYISDFMKKNPGSNLQNVFNVYKNTSDEHLRSILKEFIAYEIWFYKYREDFENSTKKIEFLEKKFAELNGLIEPHKTKIVVVNFSPTYEEKNMLKEICEKYKWNYLDILFNDCPFAVETLHPLDGHPDANGHLCAGEEIYDFLVKNNLVQE